MSDCSKIISCKMMKCSFGIGNSVENIKIYYLTSKFNLLSLALQSFFLLVFFLDLIFFLFFSLADSAFTERILGLPNENYKGYVEADATQRARHIPSNSFFLIHGLADSSAPYLHGTQLARALAKAGIIFQYQVSWNLIFFYF